MTTTTLELSEEVNNNSEVPNEPKATEEEKPKRGRGRPKGTTNKTDKEKPVRVRKVKAVQETGEPAARKRGRPKGSKNISTAVTKRLKRIRRAPANNPVDNNNPPNVSFISLDIINALEHVTALVRILPGLSSDAQAIVKELIARA